MMVHCLPFTIFALCAVRQKDFAIMGIRIYNTLSGKKEPFAPLEPSRVSMYVCGITAYDLCHVGHARSAVVFDVIYRYLKYCGFEVIWIRNFTDVDDKIIKRAQEENTDSRTIAERYIEAFYEDMDRLGVSRPTQEPRATEFIAEMIELVEILIDKGYAYVVGSDVYFAVEKFPEYGKLSKRNLDEMIAGARVAVDAHKRHPMDFALWKASKPGEPSWPSPWGEGRPGWHIECSVMSMKYLGESFDIHGGGKDLIFPHHENEIAQSEAAHGTNFAKYWVHNGFVNIDQEKMSKSLGNFFTIRQVYERYQPEVLRLFLLSSHYRSPVDFSPESMAEAGRSLERLYQTVAEIGERVGGRVEHGGLPTGSGSEFNSLAEKIESLESRFRLEMDDDFNTAAALGHLFDLSRALNRFHDGIGRKAKPDELQLLALGVLRLRDCAGVLGLLQQPGEQFFLQQRRFAVASLGLNEAEIEQLVAERTQARKEKNWARADEIRETLTGMSIILEDRPDGTRWKVKH
jgi:cysteinyl-tRNA synthetase